MKKIILAVFILINFTSFSQKSSKMTYYFYDVAFGEQFGVKLRATDVVSKTDYVKLGLEVNNQSDKFVLFFKDKCKFIVNQNSYFPRKVKKGEVIKPGKKKTFTVKSVGQTDYLTHDIDFKPGGFFTFSVKGNIAEPENFHLPANKNTVSGGNFKLNMLKLKKETSETAVKFKCTYTGDKVGIVNPSQCVIRTEDGKEWAPENSKEKIKILQKGEDVNFVLIFKIPGKITDMQFADMDIVWKNTFSESDLIEISFDVQHLNFNENLTVKKN